MNTPLEKKSGKSPVMKPRKREALKNHFFSVDNPGRFKIILRQKERSAAFMLSTLLTHEDKAEFFRTHYKGGKTEWKLRVREGLQLAPVRLCQFGWALEVYPKIGRFQYSLTLRNYATNAKPTNEQILQIIQQYLPTVKIL